MREATSVKVTHTNWQIHGDALHDIRHNVFVEEQNIDPSLEWEDIDNSATHFLALINDQPAGCARLCIEDNHGHIGRVAVKKQYRGKGIASLLMQDVIAYARAQSLTQLELNAQTYACSLYEAFGFVQSGPEFLEDGTNIPHIPMSLELTTV